MAKYLWLGMIMGMVYLALEGVWRGWTNIAMLFVGGLCGILIGILNEFPKAKKLKIWQQCIIGTIIVITLEFISGMILNIWLKLNIWDYSKLWENIKGQVSLPYAILWFLLVPLAIWLDDWLRWKLYGEHKPPGLGKIYWKLITFK